MAIVRGKDDAYWWKVRRRVAYGNGKLQTVGFMAKFRRLPKQRVAEIFKMIKDSEDISDADLIDEILIGWKDVTGLQVDEDGTPPSFDIDEDREWVLSIPGVDQAVILAWADSVAPEARIKN